MTNTELLEQYIRDSGLKKAKLADALGITYAGLAKKIRGESEFKASEIKILWTMLGIDNPVEQARVFFANEGEINSRQDEEVTT